MKKTLRRLAIVAAAVTLGLMTTACSSNRGHDHHVADHGYYHYPHRPAYHSNHHHTHYSGCGHKTVSYHYY